MKPTGRHQCNLAEQGQLQLAMSPFGSYPKEVILEDSDDGPGYFWRDDMKKYYVLFLYTAQLTAVVPALFTSNTEGNYSLRESTKIQELSSTPTYSNKFLNGKMQENT